MGGEEILTLIERSIVAHHVEAYKFMCAAHGECRDCSTQLVAFVTTDVEKAFQHSLGNNAPMWISKD